MTKETPYQKWYKENREKLNRDRKTRYHTDPEYRKQVIERQRKYRREVAAQNREAREQEGVWRMAEVAEQVGRSDQTIRLWESKGLIPKPTEAGKHRRYTNHQIDLMRRLADALDAQYESRDDMQKAVETMRRELHQRWAEE